MNQEKIGSFIAKSRKKKNLTQAELGELLGVTEKSISNWENGRNMPDISLFNPLCEILNISVNELLSGKKLESSEYQKKFEENMISVIIYSEKVVNQKNKLLGFILMLLGIFITVFGLMVFNPLGHACSFSIVIGEMFSSVGFFKIIKSKSYIKNIIYLLLFFVLYMGSILFFDYVGVVYNKRAPILSTKIITIGDVVYYDTLFYDVAICNRDEENETFRIMKNHKYSSESLTNICR